MLGNDRGDHRRQPDPLTLGDFNYFLIVDRIGLDIEIAPLLFGPSNRYPTGQRGLLAMWRNTSKVLSANAFRVLTT
jgi:predicted phage gp36 major capsid-like protein